MIGAAAWSSGRRNYEFATVAVREGRFKGLFARVAAIGCIGLAVLVVLLLFHPAGPSGAVHRGVQVIVCLSAVAVGIHWLSGSWPSYRRAVAFVVWLDVSIAALALTMSTPVAGLCVVLFMSLNGVYVGFLMGLRMEVVHLAFCSAVIAVIVAGAVLGGDSGADLATLSLLLAPTLTWVLVVCLCGTMLVEFMRKAVRKTARSAHYDPLTGLRNRRGMYAGIRDTLARSAEPVTVIAVVCDIDRFKKVNDDNGHAVGDAALAAMAQYLRSLALRTELTARIGGDELVLVSFASPGDTDAVVTELLTRLQPLTHAGTFELPLTASIGLAAHSTADPHFSVDDVLRHADSAMYDAKRSGGAACAVYATESTTDAGAGRSRPARPA